MTNAYITRWVSYAFKSHSLSLCFSVSTQIQTWLRHFKYKKEMFVSLLEYRMHYRSMMMLFFPCMSLLHDLRNSSVPLSSCILQYLNHHLEEVVMAFITKKFKRGNFQCTNKALRNNGCYSQKYRNVMSYSCCKLRYRWGGFDPVTKVKKKLIETDMKWIP